MRVASTALMTLWNEKLIEAMRKANEASQKWVEHSEKLNRQWADLAHWDRRKRRKEDIDLQDYYSEFTHWREEVQRYGMAIQAQGTIRDWFDNGNSNVVPLPRKGSV